MLHKENLLNINLDLPNHNKELLESEEHIEEIRGELNEIKHNNIINNSTYIKMFDKITRGLYYVGSLSMPAFNAQDQIENKYTETYKHAPELGKKLWLDHYHQIHKPYNTLKNRLFRLYDELDNIYIKINKTTPPQ